MVRKVASKSELDQAIADGKYLIVIDFFAEWCGPCKVIAPQIVKWAEEFDDVIFLKVDVDENDEAAEAYCIKAMPTFLFFKGGVKVDEVIGANQDKILEKIVALK